VKQEVSRAACAWSHTAYLKRFSFQLQNRTWGRWEALLRLSRLSHRLTGVLRVHQNRLTTWTRRQHVISQRAQGQTRTPILCRSWVHSLAVPESEQVLSKSLKRKFKRWISSSNAMNLAQEELQGTVSCVSHLPSLPCQPSRQPKITNILTL
jgi:hypothetical protein